ncbi:MAG: acetate--CoA ligase family protein [Myxococcales bacterium]|jgi:acetyltransferase|nr:acetate--CoA ligase family protein [Myxococcales bacterium]
MSSLQEMKALFAPKSIAVIGASVKDGSIGNTVVKNLIESGFAGAIYPINPKAPDILGIKAYASVKDVPGEVDIAVFCVPAHIVLGAARECAEKKVKGYVVITSGFSEVGHEGAELEKQLVEIAKSSGGRVIGPNIVGVLLNESKANASFAPSLPYPGKTALISQSGALLISLDMATFVRQFGASSMVSLGNMSDVDFADCIDFYAHDENTNCVSLYIEGVKDGRRFIESGRKAGKPIVALKSGVSAHGAAAAASHTGSLAGSVKVYDAAFKQAHVIRARDLDELLDRSQALALQPPMTGKNICVITNGGGIGVLASDSAEAYGVPLATVPKDLQEEFKKCMPDFGSAKNPVDITGGAGLKGYEDAIAVALKSDWVDGLAVLYCETAVTQPDEIAEGVMRAIAATGVKDKPIVACFVGGVKCIAAGKKLTAAGIPFYENPDKAMSALSALRQAAIFQAEGIQDDYVPAKDVDQATARAVIAEARADGRNVLTEPEAKKVFAAYGLPVGKSQVATSEDMAVEFAQEIGYPLVMKIVSPQIIHKSDAGGVKVNIKDEAGVRAAYKTILANAKAYNADANIHGILLQSMAPMGKEVIVGSVNDPQFGPTVMFGLGGIFVEVLKDVTFRVAPFSSKTAMDMFPEIKSYQILQGTRGEKRLDQEALSVIVSRISQLVTELSDEIAETDANPIMLYPEGQGLAVVDARIILKKK